MGKKSAEKANAALDSQSDIAKRTLDIGEKLIKESEPARKTAQATYMGIARGNVPGAEKINQPQISAATQQFYLARKAAQNLPPGAARDAALRDISLQEAAAKTNIYAGGVNEATARLASMGWGGTQAGVGAYGQAGAGYGNVGQTYNQMAGQKGAMAGSAVGGIGGFLGGL